MLRPASKLAAALAALVLCLGPVPLAGAQEAPDDDGGDPSLAPQLYGGPDGDGEPADEHLMPAQVPAGTFTPSDCPTVLPAGAGPEDVRCGHVSVPLNHDAPAGPTIQLAVAVRAATGPDPVDDPLLVLAGGPGEHLVIGLPGLLADGGPLAAANVERDVVLLDQRGVGFSRPALDCPEVLSLTDSSTDAFTAALLACRERLVAGGVDLSAFDTEANVADLDVVREALGYDTWNVFGTSYGARLALQAGRAHPDTIRSQVLSSPVPAEENFIADAATSFDAALDRLGEACAADPACTASVGGDLVGTIDQVLARLDTHPTRTDVTDPTTGQVVTVPVTDELVATVLFQLFYSGSAVPVIPALVAEMAAGDFRSTVGVLYGQSPMQLVSSQGMQLSFMCAEEVAEASRDEVEAALASTSLAPRVLVESHPIVGLPVFELCERWGVEPADPITFTPVDSGPPTLVVTGTYDQITPPGYGEDVHASLPASHLVEVPDQGHSPLLSLMLAGPCGAQVLDDFLADPEAAPDATCATSRELQVVPQLPVTPRVRATSDACPPTLVPRTTVPDVDPTSPHLPDVRCALWWQLVDPTADGTYQPAAPATREQVASAVARLVVRAGGALPADPPDAFPDDEGSPHERHIDQLAALGIVHGGPDGTFGPAGAMTRGEVATVLADALLTLFRPAVALPTADHFADDDGSPHEANTNLLAEAGIVGGQVDPATGGHRFDPGIPLRRDELASVLARTMDLLREQGYAQALPTPLPTPSPAS